MAAACAFAVSCAPGDGGETVPTDADAVSYTDTAAPDATPANFCVDLPHECAPDHGPVRWCCVSGVCSLRVPGRPEITDPAAVLDHCFDRTRDFTPPAAPTEVGTLFTKSTTCQARPVVAPACSAITNFTTCTGKVGCLWAFKGCQQAECLKHSSASTCEAAGCFWISKSGCILYSGCPASDALSCAQIPGCTFVHLDRCKLDPTVSAGAPCSSYSISECGSNSKCELVTTTTEQPCVRSCQHRECGDDHCGGSCGICGPGLVCGADFECRCARNCEGKVCGDDGCGGVCGECNENQTCDGAACVCAPTAQKVCNNGQQFWANSCGTLETLIQTCPGLRCAEGECLPCVPQCEQAECGDDQCGGSCGECEQGALCTSETLGGVCACIPDCGGGESGLAAKCGDDGCGGVCGSCTVGAACVAGQCECLSGADTTCFGDEVWSVNSCGGVEGGLMTCPDGCADGACNPCVPDCAGATPKACGDDGCGGVCGFCATGQFCEGGACLCDQPAGPTVCLGQDRVRLGGCGLVEVVESCKLGCEDGACLTCAPDCEGDPCGDDGCGSPCMQCAGGATCTAGVCHCGPGECFVSGKCLVIGKVCDDGDPCTVADACMDGFCQGEPYGCDDYNIAFVTSESIAPGALGDVAAAHAFCNERAAAGGLPGKYVAWLSHTSYSAYSGLLTATGAHASGWVRPDGLPVFASYADLMGGRFIYVLNQDEFGQTVKTQTLVVTGSTATGDMARDIDNDACQGLTSTLGEIGVGMVGTGGSLWTQHNIQNCDIPSRLYCFGVDYENPVALPAPRGRLAFISASEWVPNGGLAVADFRCQAEAESRGWPGVFKALLATTGQPPISRFTLDGPSWFRPDGARLTDNPLQLQGYGAINTMTYGQIAPTTTADGNTRIYLHERGVQVGVWFGTPWYFSPGQAGNTCADWTSAGTDETTTVHYPPFAGDAFAMSNLFGVTPFLGHAKVACADRATRLICLQDQ